MDSLIEPLVVCSSSESPPSPSSTSAKDVTTAATKRESTSSTYSSVNSSLLEPSADSSSYLSSSSVASQATTTTPSYAKKRDQIVEKFRQNYPERFLKLVTMHLSFLMNLQDDGLEELLEGQNENSKNTPAQNQNGGEKLAKFFTIKRKTTKDDKSLKLFGGNLTTDSIRRILPLINYLSEDEHCQREGIFRISGNSERQKELRELLNSAPQGATEGREADARHDFLTDISTTRFTVNDVATTFKSFLGELPEPLMSSRYYNSYLQIAAMRDSVKQLQCLQLLRFLLPNENATMLRLLLDLLNKVAAFWQLNKMSADNLAIIFTQHLFISKKLPVSQLKEATDTLKPLVVLMISNNRSFTSHNNCPEQLVHDVIRSANDVSRRRKETESESAEVESSGLKKGKKYSKTSNKKNKSKKKDVKQNDDDDDDDDGVINSVYTFSDREASRLAAQNDCTKKALEDLYSTIYTMTESAKKRRYVKNINKNDQLTTIATPTSRSSYGSHNSRRSGVSLLKVMSGRRNGPYNCLPHQLNKHQQPTDTPGKQNPTVYTNNNNTNSNYTNNKYTSNNNKNYDSELHSRTPISTYSPHLPVLRLFQTGSNDTVDRNVDHSSDIYDSHAIECIPINLSINFDAAAETTPHQQIQHQQSHQLENMSKLNDNKDDDDEGDDDDVIASMEESTSCKKSSNNDSTIVCDSDDDVDNGDDDCDNNNNSSINNNNKNNHNNNNDDNNDKNSDDEDEEKENFSPRKLRGYISPLNYLPVLERKSSSTSPYTSSSTSSSPSNSSSPSSSPSSSSSSSSTLSLQQQNCHANFSINEQNFYNKFTLPCASP